MSRIAAAGVRNTKLYRILLAWTVVLVIATKHSYAVDNPFLETFSGTGAFSAAPSNISGFELAGWNHFINNPESTILSHFDTAAGVLKVHVTAEQEGIEVLKRPIGVGNFEMLVKMNDFNTDESGPGSQASALWGIFGNGNDNLQFLVSNFGAPGYVQLNVGLKNVGVNPAIRLMPFQLGADDLTIRINWEDDPALAGGYYTIATKVNDDPFIVQFDHLFTNIDATAPRAAVLQAHPSGNSAFVDFDIDYWSVQTPVTALPGDVNNDGFVDIFDINLVSAHWGSPGGPTGDANNDGNVDIFDINLISANWAPAPGGGSTVPEPSCIVLAIAGSIAFAGLTARRRRLDARQPMAKP